MEFVKKAFTYLKMHGVSGTLQKIVRLLRQRTFNYVKWMKLNDPKESVLAFQKQYHWEQKPKVSLIVAAYNTPVSYFENMVNSVINQTYSDWELCIADGSDNDEVERKVKTDYTGEDRIKYRHLKHNCGISGNMNKALEMATGEYIVIFDHDDCLSEDALFECVKYLKDHPDCRMLYSDEDKISCDGQKRFDPYFKTEFNIDLLRTNNYICHLLMVEKKVIDEIGFMNAEFDGAQDHDFVLRCADYLKNQNIGHISKILYHWRVHEQSTALNPSSKLYAYEAGKRAVSEHYKRNGIKATVVDQPIYGFYRSIFELDGTPLVSIIIPNKDHLEDLQRCIDSIVSKSTYTNYEILIVENNSESESIFDYYGELEKTHSKVKVVRYKGLFNYSKINNYAVQYTSGDYLLFLNNDTEVIYSNWIEELLGFCQRSDVGGVGAKLLYPNDTVQHAGIVIGMGGVAGNSFVGFGSQHPGYFGQIMCARDCSAVTAACLMVKRSVFDEVKGFDETLQIAFNDVDLCLKIREKGYLIVYNPQVLLYHYESVSRGKENTYAKMKRFKGEIETFKNKWYRVLEKGDPYYNPNLTLDAADYSINIRQKL